MTKFVTDGEEITATSHHAFSQEKTVTANKSVFLRHFVVYSYHFWEALHTKCERYNDG